MFTLIQTAVPAETRLVVPAVIADASAAGGGFEGIRYFLPCGTFRNVFLSGWTSGQTRTGASGQICGRLPNLPRDTINIDYMHLHAPYNPLVHRGSRSRSRSPPVTRSYTTLGSPSAGWDVRSFPCKNSHLF